MREPGQSGKFRSMCERNNNKCNLNTAIKLTLIPSSVIKTNGHLNLIDTVLNQRKHCTKLPLSWIREKFRFLHAMTLNQID